MTQFKQNDLVQIDIQNYNPSSWWHVSDTRSIYKDYTLNSIKSNIGIVLNNNTTLCKLYLRKKNGDYIFELDNSYLTLVGDIKILVPNILLTKL